MRDYANIVIAFKPCEYFIGIVQNDGDFLTPIRYAIFDVTE